MGPGDYIVCGDSNANLGKAELPHADCQACKKCRLHPDWKNRTDVELSEKSSDKRRQFFVYDISQEGVLCILDLD